MTKDPNNYSRKIANSSGFPLQLKIADIVKLSANWKVWVEEHPWSSSETEKEGFIDLITINAEGNQALVIECKRVRNTEWIFLIPKENASDKRSNASSWISYHYQKWERFEWCDITPNPYSYESKFCVVEGQKQERKTLLESIASDLIDAVESFAIQDSQFAKPVSLIWRKAYVPVIVTTATLKVSCFEPKTININDGSLPDTTEFITVPFIRFRKNFANIKITDPYGSIEGSHEEFEKTVLIINAEYWGTFLSEWEFD